MGSLFCPIHSQLMLRPPPEAEAGECVRECVGEGVVTSSCSFHDVIAVSGSFVSLWHIEPNGTILAESVLLMVQQIGLPFLQV